MIIICNITTCVEAIKPRQIINYDAGIVLNRSASTQRKNNFRQYKSATLNIEQPHVNEEQNPRNTPTRNIRFPNQMIEQINIALEQKGSRISQPGSLKPAVGD